METLVLNCAYVALLASSFTRAMVWLRILLVVAAVAFIVYGTVEDIPSMVAWNVLIGGMHTFRILRDLQRQHSVVLTPDECAIRDDMFPGVSDFDFSVLWKIGDVVEFEPGQVLIAQGSKPDFVGVVLSGEVSVPEIADLARGDVLGELSFLSGHAAGVDVVAKGRVEMHRWRQRELHTLDQLNPASARAFQQLLNRALASKVKRA